MEPRLLSTLLQARTRKGLSQTALAELGGISRQSYAAIETGASVPSTEVALRLARALSTPVEELFRLPDLPPAAREAELPPGAVLPPSARVRLARVGGRLWAHPSGGGGAPGLGEADGRVVARRGTRVTVVPVDPPPPSSGLVVAGCDPSFSLVSALLRRERGVESLHLPVGSRRALELLAAGAVHVAGVHLREPEGVGYNGAWVHRLVPFPCLRVGYAVWTQDLLVAPSQGDRVRGLADLARPGIRFAAREEGSGTRALVDAALAEAGMDPGELRPPSAGVARGHLAVAEAVASGWADAGVAVRAAGEVWGLRGIPVGEERYDLVIPLHFLELPRVEALLDLLSSPSLRRQVEGLAGYDVAGMGEPA